MELPTILSAIGNIMLIVACLFIGQYRSLGISNSMDLTQVMYSLFGCGYGIILISSFDRVYRQALKNGISDDIETYLMVSGNVYLTGI